MLHLRGNAVPEEDDPAPPRLEQTIEGIFDDDEEIGPLRRAMDELIRRNLKESRGAPPECPTDD